MGVEGSIQTRNYEDKSGNKRTATEVVADNIFFVGGKSSNAGTYTASPVQSAPAPMSESVAYSSGTASDFEEMEPDNDLPF